jgi:hypothetical protein
MQEIRAFSGFVEFLRYPTGRIRQAITMIKCSSEFPNLTSELHVAEHKVALPVSNRQRFGEWASGESSRLANALMHFFFNRLFAKAHPEPVLR